MFLDTFLLFQTHARINFKTFLEFASQFDYKKNRLFGKCIFQWENLKNFDFFQMGPMFSAISSFQ